MLRVFGCQRCRQGLALTYSVCLLIYVTVVVALHIHLSQFIFDPISLVLHPNVTKSTDSGARFLHFLFSNGLRSSSVSDINANSLDVESFLNPPLTRRSTVAFPAVSGCPTFRRPWSSSLGSSDVGFQSIGIDYLYTAYVDDRLQPSGPSYIRIFALLRRRLEGESLPKFYVQLFGRPSKNHPVVTSPLRSPSEAAALYEMCENHKQRYGGWIVSWQLPRSAKRSDGSLGCYVEVIARSDNRVTSVSDRVTVPLFRMSHIRRRTWQADSIRHQRPTDTELDQQAKNITGGRAIVDGNQRHDDRLDFAVCVPPLFGDINAATLVQFVELSRLLGADHFIFYVLEQPLRSSHHQWSSTTTSTHPVSEVVRSVLERYVGIGVATVVRWELPVEVIGSVWYGGQLVAANDCLYRTAHAFRHVIFNDLDEFLIPRHALLNSDEVWSTVVNWRQMIDGLRKRTKISADGEASLISPSSSVHVELWSEFLRRVDRLWPFRASDHRDGVMDGSSTSPMTSSEALGAAMPCGYSFQSAFFTPMNWKRPLFRSVMDLVPSYDISASTRRSQFSRVRTKVMVRPEAVFEVGIHHVSRPLFTMPSANNVSSPSSSHSSSFRRRPHRLLLARQANRSSAVGPSVSPLSHKFWTKVLSVPPDVGLVHHYRYCMTNYDTNMDCSGNTFIDDDGLARTGHIPALRLRVRRVLEEFLTRPVTPRSGRPQN